MGVDRVTEDRRCGWCAPVRRTMPGFACASIAPLVVIVRLCAVALAAHADVTDPGLGRQAIVSREQIYPLENRPTPSCHASTVVETTGGGLVAAWFGGEQEGAADVGIWVSRRNATGWSGPVEVATWRDPDGSRRPCWNPVLFTMPDHALALFYKASGNPRTWKGLVRTSVDGGTTWSEPAALAPVGDSETALAGVPVGPIKNKPVTLADGTILSPSSTEDDGWRVHFERSTDGGATWRVIGPVNDGRTIDAIQPSILHLGGTRLLALGRTRNKRLFRVESVDAGLTWGAMTLTDLPNPNSGTDAVTLADGRHLLVYNHTEKGRSPLTVAVSRDAAAWTPVVTLESAPGEYSYPAVIQAADGRVHVTYTWNRQTIVHVVLDPAKLGG
jgi:predicted neuraminidase